MNIVLIASESRYPIRRRKISKTVIECLNKAGVEDAEVSVAIVGSRKIRELNKKWRSLDEETTVLTFAAEEPRDEKGVLYVGDIVISYPQAREIAMDEGLIMDGAIEKLLIHGMRNLLGNNNNLKF